MTGIGYGPIGENEIGGSVGGGIGVGGIGIGPIGGGTAGHVPSSIGDTYQIERINLPAVLEDSYDLAVSATAADSYRVHVAPVIDSAYSIGLASARLAAYNIEVAGWLSGGYHICIISEISGSYHIQSGIAEVVDTYSVFVRALLEEAYNISGPVIWSPTPAVISGGYEVCRGLLPMTINFPEEYRFKQVFVVPGLSDSTAKNYVFGPTDTTGAAPLVIYRCDGSNSARTLFVGKGCRADFGDLAFIDTVTGARIPHLLNRTYFDAGKNAEAAEISILLANTRLYSSRLLLLCYGLDHLDPSPTWPALPTHDIWDFSCSWGTLTPKYTYPNPTGAYNIQVGRPVPERYRIHLAKIMEG